MVPMTVSVTDADVFETVAALVFERNAAQKQAIASYTGSGYGGMNEALRSAVATVKRTMSPPKLRSPMILSARQW